MEVESIKSFAVSIPLEEPVSFATRTVEERDHVITFVRTADGTEGVGYSLGYGGSTVVASAVEDVLADVVVGEDPRDTERLWREMFDGTVQIGRKGLMLRAIASIDIALWDIAAKAADTPPTSTSAPTPSRSPRTRAAGTTVTRRVSRGSARRCSATSTAATTR